MYDWRILGTVDSQFASTENVIDVYRLRSNVRKTKSLECDVRRAPADLCKKGSQI